MDLDIETKTFIDAVKSQPAIWNANCEDNHDRIKKKEAWFSVCEELVGGFNDMAMSEKVETGKKLMKRWKSIVDNYRKSELKRFALKSRGVKCNKRYLYARYLSFLSIIPKRTRSGLSFAAHEEYDHGGGDESDVPLPSSSDTELANDLIPDAYEPSFKVDNMPATKGIRIVENNPMRPTELHTVQLHATPIEDLVDDDKSFFDSLLPAVKTLSMDNKLDFRCEVLKLLTTFRGIQKKETNQE